MMSKPRILVTNDDGIDADGIKALVSLMQEIGEVIVMAPTRGQSAVGHAITIREPLRYIPVDSYPGIEAYRCTGTPADCVKLSKSYVHKDNLPDLVVSGINHGTNTSTSVLYSGTMAAAIEASLDDIPAIGFSVCDYNQKADLSYTYPHIKKITEAVLKNGLPKGVSLNVNFPENKDGGLKGVKVCRQADAKWEEVLDEHKDPQGKAYFWLTGRFVNFDKGDDHDEKAIAEGYGSIVPIKVDMTDHEFLKQLKEFDFNL